MLGAITNWMVLIGGLAGVLVALLFIDMLTSPVQSLEDKALQEMKELERRLLRRTLQ